MGVWLLVAVLATYRITRIITTDTIADPVRTRVLTWLLNRQRHMAADLLMCGHCAGWWVALPVGAVAGVMVGGLPVVGVVLFAVATAGAHSLILTLMEMIPHG